MRPEHDRSRIRIALDLAMLAALCVPVIFYGLGSYSVVNGDEAIYHGIAEAMVESGDWLRLDFRGTPRPYDTFMNAPLQYWARAALIEAFGSHLWTMRIGSALFGLASVFATYALALRLRDRRAAVLAAIVQLTTLHFVAIHGARTGELDTAIAFFVTATVLAFLHAVERPASRTAWLVHHLCLAALVTLKLPIVIVPVMAELLCFAVFSRFRSRFTGWLMMGAVIAPIGLGWHLYQIVELGDTALGVFDSMLGHATGGADLDSPIGFWVNVRYYGEALLFAAFPYALVYPVALGSVLAKSRRDPNRDRFGVLAVFLLALAVFHLGLAAHLRQYLIPAYPMLSIFVAVWLIDMTQRPAEYWATGAAAAVGALLIWLAIDFGGFNPFATQANLIPMQLGWREIGGIAPVLGVLLTATILGAALFAMRSRLAERSGHALALCVGIALVSTAALRVGLPLRHLGHQSEMALLRERIDRDRAAGRPIALPIEISERGLWRARYYFARDFQVLMRVRPGSGREGVQFMLDAKTTAVDER